MNRVLLFLKHPCLLLGGCLPFLAAHGGAGCCSQPGKASPQRPPSHTTALGGTPRSTPCPGFAAAGTLGTPTHHCPGLQQPTAPAPPSFTPPELSPLPSPCHPWAAMGLRGALPGDWGSTGGGGAGTPPRWHCAERRSGKGVGRQGSPPPGSAAPAPFPGPTIPFITPPPFIGPDRCPQINTPRQWGGRSQRGSS